jgi:hypothetical protein
MLRSAADPDDFLVCVFNFTPQPRHGYVFGVPRAGTYTELLNSDGGTYGGSNVGNNGHVTTDPVASHGYPDSVRLTLPPLACLMLKPSPRVVETEIDDRATGTEIDGETGTEITEGAENAGQPSTRRRRGTEGTSADSRPPRRGPRRA